MILDHYLQLFFYYRRLVIWIVLSFLAAAAGLSMAILLVFPSYTSAATVAILPTEAELAYTRGFSGEGQASPMAMMPATHIEYLLSRPVAELVLERVRAQLDQGTELEGWRLTVKESVNEIITFTWMVYNTLNSGKFIEPTPYEQALRRLMKGIDLEIVENSYILRIEVTVPQNARASSLAANALAEAYIERVNEQTAKVAQSLIDYIDGEVAGRNAQYNALQQQEFLLRQEAGILSLEEERQSLLDTRRLEQERLLEIKIEREELEARLQAYENDRAGLQRRGTLALVEEEIALSAAHLSALARREALRQQSVQNINQELAALNERENPIAEIQKEMTRIQGEINGLKERRIALSLSQSKTLSMVRIVNPAVEPVYASFPQVVVNTVIAAVASVFVVFFVLIAADTLPGTIKTSIDLRRVAGSRSLGRLPRNFTKRLLRAKDGTDAALSALFERAGRNIEQKMGGLGFFEAPIILVTGFGSPEKVGVASLGFAGAIASLGTAVNWRVADDWKFENTDLLRQIGIMSPDADDTSDNGAKPETGNPLSLECVGPVSSRFSWSKIAGRSAPLVCIFDEGEITEEELLEFCAEAEKRDVPGLAFLMTGT